MGIDLILDGLTEKGFAVVPHFLDAAAVSQLASVMQERRSLFYPAGIGRQAGLQVSGEIRGDDICWLDASDPLAGGVLGQLDAVKAALNSQLFLGLHELECHFAAYPVGTFYKRHLDQHRGEDTRLVTVVLYLNPEWNKEDGGELRLYLDEQQHLDIIPQGGTLVVFLSGQFDHEVLISKRERLSLTGWFRRRS